MAERTLIVCDICGEPAQQTVAFKVGARNRAQDLCGTHLQELVRQSHAPKRGRRPGAAPVGRPRKRSPQSRGKRTSRSPSSRKRATAKSTRRRITDPTTLAKRRAALAKAREALAKKRASAA